MYSIIVSIKDQEKFNKILLVSLLPTIKYLRDNNLPEMQIVEVSGEKSLAKNYNEGIDKCKWKTKFFIHEDVDLIDQENFLVIPKVYNFLNQYSDFGLVGLAGTMDKNIKTFWWECKKELIVGHVLVNNEYWEWKHDNAFYEVEYIDGMFMATNTSLKFPEIDGFHFYDRNYCDIMRNNHYKIAVIPYAIHHKATPKDLSKIFIL